MGNENSGSRPDTPLFTKRQFKGDRGDEATNKGKVMRAIVEAHADEGLDINDKAAILQEIVEERGIVSQATLYRYFKDGNFQEALSKMAPWVASKTMATKLEILTGHDSKDSDKLKAASSLEESVAPEVFDSGVRREKIRNEGNKGLMVQFVEAMTNVHGNLEHFVDPIDADYEVIEDDKNTDPDEE